MTLPSAPVRASRLSGATLVTMLLLASAAQAQNTSVPDQYRAVTSALDTAVRLQAQNPSRSLTEIDRARDQFDQLAPNFRGPLVAGARASLQNARIAVGRTAADLEAQSAQARGVLRKLLHDRALGGVNRKDQNAAVEIGVLADDFGLIGATRAAVVNAARAGDADLARRLLERTATMKIVASLDAANGAQTAAAYVAVARASGWFTIVQDSPRAGKLTVQRFVDALSALTTNDVESFRLQLAALRTDAVMMRDAASRAADSAASRSRETPASVTPPAPEAAAGSEAATGANPAAAPARAPAVVQQEAVTTDGSLADVYAPLGRAMSASTRGDVPAAQRELGTAASELDRLPAALRSQEAVQELRAALTAVAGAVAIRPADVQALTLQAAATEDAVAGRPARVIDTLSIGAASTFGGTVRVAVFVLLGLLAAWPLYLLNLAFGGRNPYWRAISAAVVLLLLPLMLEGLASLSVLAAQFTGASVLAAGAYGSVLQTPFGQVLWAVLSAFGIALMAWGFRGICVQFGLLGRKAAVSETVVQQPAVDWDDEP